MTTAVPSLARTRCAMSTTVRSGAGEQRVFVKWCSGNQMVSTPI